MTPYTIAQATAEVVSLEETKKSLRVSSDDYNDLISACILAAVSKTQAWLRLALRPQTLEVRLDGFPYSCRYRSDYRDRYAIELPFPPLISVVSVKYDDSGGVEQTLVEDTDYRVIGLGLKETKARVIPVYNESWPSVRSDVESVRVRFTAGFGASPDLLPHQIKPAILLSVRALWSQLERNLYISGESAPGLAAYEYTVSKNAQDVIESAVANLLSELRIIE